MTTSALIGGVVGGVAGLGLIVGFAWAGYLVAERRRRGQLCALKVDVETPAVRTLVPVPMPGATYEPPVPILVAAHTGWGVRPPTRPKARRMMRSPARRASENALPALLELGESEFEECEGPESDENLHHAKRDDKEEPDWEEGQGVGHLGFSDDSGGPMRTDTEYAPYPHEASSKTYSEHADGPAKVESQMPESEDTHVRPRGDGRNARISTRPESAPDLAPPKTSSSLGSIPATPTTPGDISPIEFVLTLGADPPEGMSSSSEPSTPSSSPRGTLERPKRRDCTQLGERRSLGPFIRGHYV